MSLLRIKYSLQTVETFTLTEKKKLSFHAAVKASYKNVLWKMHFF